MCGICGSLAPGISLGDLKKTEFIVGKFLHHQRRRGPDFERMIQIKADGGHVTLGHNRLAIIDLTHAANQPLWSVDRRHCIVFNGEIYNYLEIKADLEARGRSFVTKSDTEVILEAYREWGMDCLSHFIGMYAFALWDVERSELILARDRFGVKPLYYHFDNSGIFFSSMADEIGRVFGLGPDIRYLSRGLLTKMYEDDSENCQFLGLKSLRPGHVITARLENGRNTISIQDYKYYDLSESTEKEAGFIQGMDETSLLDRFSDILQDSISLRLRSDVPIGISLSGGIDSTTVASISMRKITRFSAFSFGDPSGGPSEGSVVSAFAKDVGLTVHFINPTAKTIADSILSVLDDQESPFPNASMIAQNLVFKHARNLGVKVMLGGQGADEILMGYHKYKIFLLQHAIRSRDIGGVLKLSLSLMPMLLSELWNLPEYWKERHRFIRTKKTEKPLFNTSVGAYELQGLKIDNIPRDRQILDVVRYSLPTLLRYEDRNSMGNGVESRLPFMDHRLVHFCLALPDKLKVRNGFGKWPLRAIGRELIPKSIRMTRKKRGFDIDQHTWIVNGLGAHIRNLLHEHQYEYTQYLSFPIDIDKRFNNEKLSNDRFAFQEAISLIWLGRLNSSNR